VIGGAIDGTWSGRTSFDKGKAFTRNPEIKNLRRGKNERVKKNLSIKRGMSVSV